MSAPLTYRSVRARRSSGRNGYPAVRFVFEIHYGTFDGRGIDYLPLLRKDGTPREYSTRQRARAAILRMRAAEGGAA